MVSRVIVWIGLNAVVVAIALSGCSSSREQTKTTRTATEQFLLTQAVGRSLDQLSVPLPRGASVFVEAVGVSPDQALLRDLVADQLSEEGALIKKKEEEAAYLVRVIVQSFGTEQLRTFVGVPPIQGGIIPLSLPELALYKKDHQVAVSRFYLDVLERSTGRYIVSTRQHEGDAYYKQYTALFVITWQSTDLSPPP